MFARRAEAWTKFLKEEAGHMNLTAGELDDHIEVKNVQSVPVCQRARYIPDTQLSVKNNQVRF